MNHARTTPPAALPLSLASAKAHLVVEEDHDDDLITAYIEAATAHLDGSAGVLARALVTQTWTLTVDGWYGIELPLAPVQSIAEIRYRDVDGVVQILPSSEYVLFGDDRCPTIILAAGASWPDLGSGPGAVEIDYVCGYGDPEDVPAPLVQAVRLHIGTLYKERESIITGTIVAKTPHAHDALIEPYRRVV